MLKAVVMGHPLRQYLPSVVYEVTIRVMQGRFLLRPDARSRDIVNGVIARAQVLYPDVRVHAFDCQSNHLHQLLSASDGGSIAPYLCYVHGRIALLVGKLRGWAGHFWSRRCRVIPVLDDDAVIGRLRYVLAQGVAANLVASPRDWPGASSTPGLLGTMTMQASCLVGMRSRTHGEKIGRPQRCESMIRLLPIPPWAHLSRVQVQGRHAAMVADIERDHAGRRVLGAMRVIRQDPFGAPASFESSRAPACHGSTLELCGRFREAYRRFRAAFAAAAARVRAAMVAAKLTRSPPPTTIRPRSEGSSPKQARGTERWMRVAAGFPIGSCPRPDWYVRPPRSGTTLPWSELLTCAA